MSARARAVALLAGLALTGCGGTTPPAQPEAAAAAPTRAAATADAPGPTTVLAGVELEVTGLHMLPGAADDPLVQSAAERWGVPAGRVVQMHLMLRWRNTGTRDRDVSADAVELRLGSSRVPPVPGQVFPTGPLGPGQSQETAAGFLVAVRPSDGPVTLRWRHGTRTAVLPLGGLRLSA